MADLETLDYQFYHSPGPRPAKYPIFLEACGDGLECSYNPPAPRANESQEEYDGRVDIWWGKQLDGGDRKGWYWWMIGIWSISALLGARAGKSKRQRGD